MKRILCAVIMCGMLSGCGDGWDKVKVKDHINKTRPNEVCVPAPSGSEFSAYGFICKDTKGTVSYVFYGGKDLKSTSEVVLIK